MKSPVAYRGQVQDPESNLIVDSTKSLDEPCGIALNPFDLAHLFQHARGQQDRHSLIVDGREYHKES